METLINLSAVTALILLVVYIFLSVGTKNSPHISNGIELHENHCYLDTDGNIHRIRNIHKITSILYKHDTIYFKDENKGISMFPILMLDLGEHETAQEALSYGRIQYPEYFI